MTDVLNRPETELRATLRSGREFAKDFTGEHMWRKYLGLYESLLGQVG